MHPNLPASRKNNYKSESFQVLKIGPGCAILGSEVSMRNEYRDVHWESRKKDKQPFELPKISPIHHIVPLKKRESSHKDKSKLQLKGQHIRYSPEMNRYISKDFHNEANRIKELTFLCSHYGNMNNTQNENTFWGVWDAVNVNRIKQSKKTKYTVYIQQGNNSRLLKELFRKRTILKVTANKDEANIVWSRFLDWEACKNSILEVESIGSSNRTLQVDSTSRSVKLGITASGLQIIIGELHIHNHFKNHDEISDKKNLFKNIVRYCQRENYEEWDIIPQTFHYKQGDEQVSQEIDNGIWIVKPGEDSNRGHGIELAKSREQVLKSMQKLLDKGKTVLVQKYICPLLYRNRKFDVRCYVLITSALGEVHAFWYREGYLRTCSKEFSMESTEIYRHLTNDAVQKLCKDYGKYEPSNKLSFTDLQALLLQNNFSFKQVYGQMKRLAQMSIRAALESLRCSKSMLSYQIFGYDFLIDQSGKVWLIQINTNPCLQFQGSLLSRIISHMVENTLRLVIDPLINWAQFRKDEHANDTNRYQLLF